MQLINVLYLVFISTLLMGCSSMQLYYLKEAKMVAFSESDKAAFTESRPEAVKLLSNGHYVKSGDNLVLLIRRFDKGSIFTVDDEVYEKLTIEIKKFEIGTPIKVDSPDINIYYSSGSSGFISKGHGVYSASASGSIVVKKIDKHKIVVALDLEILAEPAGPFPFEGRKVQISDLLIFNKKKVEDLTPWLGAPATSFGKEVYP